MHSKPSFGEVRSQTEFGNEWKERIEWNEPGLCNQHSRHREAGVGAMILVESFTQHKPPPSSLFCGLYRSRLRLTFNPEPGTTANSGGPTALVDSTGRLAVGSGLDNL